MTTQSNVENLIPCEWCQQLVSYDQYAVHVNTQCTRILHLHDDDVGDITINLGVLFNMFFDTSPTLSNIYTVLVQDTEIDVDVDMNVDDFIELPLQLHSTKGVSDINAVLTTSNLHFCSDDICPICLELFTPESVCAIQHCHHLFCKSCITKWLTTHTKCPVCQANLQDLKIDTENN